MLLIYLILKSYPKYKIDRDIANNADKNRKKQQKSTQGTCNTLFTRRIYYTKIKLFISSRVNLPGSRFDKTGLVIL